MTSQLALGALIMFPTALIAGRLSRFVDLLFVEGMAVAVVGALMASGVMQIKLNRSRLTSTTKTGLLDRVVHYGVSVFLVGLLLVVISLLVGEIFIRRVFG